MTEFVRLKQRGAEQTRRTEELRQRTQRMELEIFLRAQEVQDANRKLESANEELAQGNEELQRLTSELGVVNRELEAFSFSVAHDLRAPLRAIEGFCQALQADLAGGLDPNSADLFQRVVNSARHMGQLINGLLGLSQLTRTPLNPQPVDLSLLAEWIAQELREAAPDRSVDVHVQPHSWPPETRACCACC